MPVARVGTLLGSLTLLCCVLSAAAPPRLRHRQLSRALVDERVLALAFVGEGRVLALAAGSVSLWRLEGGALRREARETWPVAVAPVRHGGGLIVGRPDERAAWLVSSYAEGARLVRVDGARLVLGDTADAAPWPGAPEGLRFRPGTNLIDGLATGDGAQLIVALDPVSRAVVREDGMLLVDAVPTGMRVGSAIASPWPRTLVASAPDPPAVEDALLVLRYVGSGWQEALKIRVPGVVSALAARGGSGASDVVVALVSAAGPELLRLELRPQP